MNQEVMGLMKLQGVLRVAFVHAGIGERKAVELAAEALHLFVTSNAVKDEYYQAYESMKSHADEEE